MERLEKTFTVATDPETAWQRLTSRPGRTEGRLVLPGFEADVPVAESTPARRLVAHKDEHPCKDTTIEIELEESADGCRVTVSQSGFDLSTIPTDLLEVGWAHITADLAVALGRGTRLGRHGFPWPMLGLDLIATSEGLVVRGAWEHEGAVDLQPGDLLVAVGGAPISSRADLESVLRTAGHGATLVVRWLRGTDPHEAPVTVP